MLGFETWQACLIWEKGWTWSFSDEIQLMFKGKVLPEHSEEATVKKDSMNIAKVNNESLML